MSDAFLSEKEAQEFREKCEKHTAELDLNSTLYANILPNSELEHVFLSSLRNLKNPVSIEVGVDAHNNEQDGTLISVSSQKNYKVDTIQKLTGDEKPAYINKDSGGFTSIMHITNTPEYDVPEEMPTVNHGVKLDLHLNPKYETTEPEGPAGPGE